MTFPTVHLLSEGRWGIEKIVDQNPPQPGGAPLRASPQTGALPNSLHTQNEATCYIRDAQDAGRTLFDDHVTVDILDNA